MHLNHVLRLNDAVADMISHKQTNTFHITDYSLLPKFQKTKVYERAREARDVTPNHNPNDITIASL